MKKPYKKSIIRRLQNSLMSASFLSIVLTIVPIFIIILLAIRPVGLFLTNTVNNSIMDNYKSQKQMYYNIQHKRDLENIRMYTYEELKSIDFSNQLADITDEHMMLVEEEFSESFEHSLKVWGDEDTLEDITEEEKKDLFIATYDAIERMDRVLMFGQYFGFDWVKVSFVLFNDQGEQVEYVLPSENVSFLSDGDLKEVVDEIPVYTRDDRQIGYIRTQVNSSVVVFFVFPVLLIFIIIAIVVFVIVKIVLTPRAYKLVKPIKSLNTQLQKISEHEVLDSSVHIEMHKPPKEIYELIKYSNIIMARLNESQELLFAQNQELEAQRDVLEDQNMELDAQKSELEEKNEELDSQNDALIQSQIQLQKAQDQLVQSEKMASVGQLSAAIAHEINTPLGAVSSNVQMMDLMLMKLKKLLSEEKYEDVLKAVEKLSKSNAITADATSRVNDIIRNLRNFSRIDQAAFQNANVHEGIHSVLVLTSNLWKNKLTITENYGTLPEISCYASLLNQVFMNVLVNGIQATEKGGLIEIKTSLVDDYARIEFIDDGMGIPEDKLDMIFDSGFTMKPEDEGTGLGLSISRDIIKKHHGKISAKNNEGKGATIIIDLPLTQPIHDENCDHD
ncbi:HAMP domain-containing histidine kinase [Acidaminobacter sp. JC074]|uniref:sensor histidine kinase n=1 Tax=Acidaminobacter sp. JC074 TaxID=2530199 RepID=UPI001F10E42A|nr:HAMP domain-containing sensor histidine kinase [Acidaminobacter sp. JC074]MCH4885997.1 HAMP domain-containing histidine kinase [Acidaminobacter sp. JC074]